MAENPQTWTDLERTIHNALKKAEDQRAKEIVGHSTPRIVADELRRRGLARWED